MIDVPVNAARCLRCKDVIVSRHRHDFVTCSCGNVSVDGGKDYRRRCYRSDEWEEVTMETELSKLPS